MRIDTRNKDGSITTTWTGTVEEERAWKLAEIKAAFKADCDAAIPDDLDQETRFGQVLSGQERLKLTALFTPILNKRNTLVARLTVATTRDAISEIIW